MRLRRISHNGGIRPQPLPPPPTPPATAILPPRHAASIHPSSAYKDYVALFTQDDVFKAAGLGNVKEIREEAKRPRSAMSER